MMLPILSTVLGLEVGLALLLISKVPPLEKLACWIIDLTKTTRGSAVIKTLAATFCIFLASSISTYLSAQRQWYLAQTSPEMYGHVGEAEAFLLRSSEMESALTGFILVQALMVNRVHYYLRGKRGLTVQLEYLKKQSKSAQAEYLRLNDEKSDTVAKQALESENSDLKDIIASLKGKVEKAQQDVGTKEKELKASESNAQAIRKQSEGMALEYERLLEDNEHLRTQISSFDSQHSRSASKKNT